jgi:hypothetical protein
VHPARKAGFVFLFAAFASIAASLIYGEVTTGRAALEFGWVLFWVTGALIAASCVSFLVAKVGP